MSEDNSTAVATAENNKNVSSSSNDDNDSPYANSFDNYLKYVEKLEHSPKISKDDLAEVKDVLRGVMSEYPTLFCKLFSGYPSLLEEAKREARRILYEIENSSSCSW